jgi:hypothetical protein
MNGRTIEILLLFGIVFVSLGIIALLGRGYAARLEREGFQGVASGAQSIFTRGSYARPSGPKATLTDEGYKQISKIRDAYGTNVYKRDWTQRTYFIRTIKFECDSSWCDFINFSLIRVWSNGVNVALWDNGANQDGSNPCGGSWCGDVMGTRNYNSPAGWGNIYHSRDTGKPIFQVNLKQSYVIDSIDVFNRADCCQDRLAGYSMKLYENNSTTPRYTFKFTKELRQTFKVTPDCPSGYSSLGNVYVNGAICITSCNAGDLEDNYYQCYSPCRSGYTMNNLTKICTGQCAADEVTVDEGIVVTCYKNCQAGWNLVGGYGGTCKKPCPAGYTQSGSTFYKDCVAPNLQLDTTRCYTDCKSDEEARVDKCMLPCPSATHRLIGDTCFPKDPRTYLPVAWTGTIISQADTERNVGLTQSLGGHNGAAIGLWGSISEAANSTNYGSDQVWAYTEDMELTNMFSRKCMDAGGAAPCMWDCTGVEWQKWVIDSEGRIRSKNDMNQCLTAIDWTPKPGDGDPIVQLTINKQVSLKPCTNDGNKFQRWNFPARTGINQAVSPAVGPPALPSEPLIRDAFTDGSGSGRDSTPLAARLAERLTEDAF